MSIDRLIDKKINKRNSDLERAFKKRDDKLLKEIKTLKSLFSRNQARPQKTPKIVIEIDRGRQIVPYIS